MIRVQLSVHDRVGRGNRGSKMINYETERDLRAYPVDLVEIVRLEDDTAADTGTAGSLHDNLSLAEEEVEVGLNGRSFTLLADDEVGTLIGKGDIVGGSNPSTE